MSEDVARLFASKFISRPDVFAIQKRVHGDSGEDKVIYTPVLDGNKNRIPWQMDYILAHIEGRRTLGHYLLGEDSTVKLFCLDVDLTKKAKVPASDPGQVWDNWCETNPRELWRTCTSSGMAGVVGDVTKPEVLKYMIFQLRAECNKLARITFGMDIQTAVLYSGNKGFHVYGFLPKGTPAAEARLVGQVILEEAGWQLSRGSSVYAPKDDGTDISGADLLTAELFPKQDSLEGKDLGNLIRLPLGINLRGGAFNNSFFVDLRTRMVDLVPRDPMEALTVADPWV